MIAHNGEINTCAATTTGCGAREGRAISAAARATILEKIWPLDLTHGQSDSQHLTTPSNCW